MSLLLLILFAKISCISTNKIFTRVQSGTCDISTSCVLATYTGSGPSYCAARCAQNPGCGVFSVDGACADEISDCTVTCTEVSENCRMFSFAETGDRRVFSDGTVVPVRDVSWGKNASQVSVSETNIAELALDGSTKAHVAYCAVTEAAYQAWWRLDMGGRYSVVSVTVTNRYHKAHLLNEFDLRLGNDPVDFSQNSLCYHWSGDFGSGTTRTLWCQRAALGRYLSLQRTTSDLNPLQVCEVKAMGAGPFPGL